MQSVNAPVWGSIPEPGRCKVDIICIEPPRPGGVTHPCREHWQVLVTQLLGGALIEFQIIKKSAIRKIYLDINSFKKFLKKNTYQGIYLYIYFISSEADNLKVNLSIEFNQFHRKRNRQ